ncbi:MAG TPA: hypothetical protein EYH03_07405, partial [Chromatiales bacterium]|nr:hypothetical protein [Chromatiales bacterium]
MIRPLLLILALSAPLAAWSAIPITAASLNELLVPRRYDVPATVTPLNHSHIGAEITGRIASIPVRVGDQLGKGTPLVHLDCRLPRSRLSGAIASRNALRAQLKLARNQLRRARNLSSGRTISDEEVERRESEVDALTAQIESQDEAIRQA